MPNDPISATDEMLTAQDIARATTLATSALCDWRKAGIGPRWIRLGSRRIAYPRADFEAWLAKQEQGGGHSS